MTLRTDRVAEPAPPLGVRPEAAAHPPAPSLPPTTSAPPSAEQAEPDGSPDAPLEAALALPRGLQVLGSVVAPTTLLSGLFFYFGLLYAIAYYRYFGVNYSVLNLPFTGVLVLSASTAVVPLAVLSVAALVVLWAYRLPLDKASPRTRRLLLRGLLPLVALGGVVLLGLAVADVLAGARVFGRFLEGRGLSIAVGMVLLGYAARLRRALLPARAGSRAHATGPLDLTVAKWVCLCALFGIGLFWVVGSHALREGTADAQGLALGLACGPDVILYSQHELDLASAGVSEERTPGAEGGYAFRYSRFKLVPQPGDTYLLLPADWAPDARPAILLPHSDSVRLEFVTTLSSRPASC